jgi:hypothetical protein
MSRPRHNWSAYLAAVIAALMLVACAEEDAGPQFATDPRPTQLPTKAAASPPALLPTTAPVATPASFTDLLAVRGAVSTVFVVSGNEVWSVSSTGAANRLLVAPTGSTIRAIDPAPDAQEVAVLLETAASERRSFQAVIVDLSGSVATRTDVPAAAPASTTAQATPVARDAAGRQTIDWSPQGDRVLAQIGSSDIVEFTPDAGGAPVPLDFDGASGSVIDPVWSPTGQSIGFISEREEGEMRSLEVLESTSGEIRNVVTLLAGRLVVDFAWLPDGVSLLFTEGGGPGNAITGIDLWRVDVNGENRALVASAGTVAPVARIANLSPSPDGRSVAYSVLIPGSRGPAVDSVWVRSLGSGVGFRIPLPSVASVEDIWWTDEGLVVSVVTRGTAQGRLPTKALLQVKRDGSIAALWAAPTAVDTPAAATPVARPGAT